MSGFKLNNNSKIGTGFKAPEGYFEGFAEKIMQQLPEKQAVVKPLYKQLPAWLSAAAVFILLAGIGFFIRPMQSTSAPESSDIKEYLVYQTNFSSDDIMQHLDQQDIDELEESIAISDDAIENYLNENVYLSE